MQDVAVALSRSSSVRDAVVVPPARNKTRDAQRKKAVTEQINLHCMADIQGDSAIVKGKFFSHFNESEGVEGHQEGSLGIEFTHHTHAHTHTHIHKQHRGLFSFFYHYDSQ